VSREESQQTSRTRPLPPSLAVLLEAVNGLPTTGVPMQFGMSITTIQMARLYGKESERLENIEGLRTISSTWAPATVSYIFSDPEPGLKIMELISARGVFEQLVRNSESKGRLEEPFYLEFKGGVELSLRSGKVEARLAPFLADLNGIEAFRIRTCAICGQFFWAGRSDKRCCGDKCSHVLRQRELRARAVQNQDRVQENRKYKKRLNQRRKERRNG
jgi:hypothetical protein